MAVSSEGARDLVPQDPDAGHEDLHAVEGRLPAMAGDVMTSKEELRSIYRPPSSRAVAKQRDRLDHNCAAFICHSPFMILATIGADGLCDVSPKGGPPCFVAALDHKHPAIPDFS